MKEAKLEDQILPVHLKEELLVIILCRFGPTAPESQSLVLRRLSYLQIHLHTNLRLHLLLAAPPCPHRLLQLTCLVWQTYTA